MGKYLLTLMENSGGHDHITKHVIKADNRQMVKYHFHRTLKDFGMTDSSFGKHCLENWGQGITMEIHSIERLDKSEYQILERYVGHWTKV